MRSVTVAALIVRIRRWVSADGDTAFLPDTEVLDYLNEEWPRVYAIYTKAYPELFRTEVETTTDGTAFRPLPADFFATIGVDYKQSASRYFRLRRLMEAERNRYNGTSSQRSRSFRVIQNSLYFYPTPPTGQVYRHIYLPTAPVLGLGDSIDGILGHEKFLELECAIRIIAAKDEADAGQLVALRDRCLAEVQEEATMRQAEESIYPVDEYDEDYDEGSLRWSPP